MLNYLFSLNIYCRKYAHICVTIFIAVHKAPITHLASDHDMLVSADELGTIVTWKVKGSGLVQISNIRGEG